MRKHPRKTVEDIKNPYLRKAVVLVLAPPILVLCLALLIFDSFPRQAKKFMHRFCDDVSHDMASMFFSVKAAWRGSNGAPEDEV